MPPQTTQCANNLAVTQKVMVEAHGTDDIQAKIKGQKSGQTEVTGPGSR